MAVDINWGEDSILGEIIENSNQYLNGKSVGLTNYYTIINIFLPSSLPSLDCKINYY